MNKNIPTEDEIEDLLRRIQPDPEPSFKQTMAQQPWNQKINKPFITTFTFSRVAVAIGLIIFLSIGVSLFAPSLNTLAERFTLFFSPSPSSQVQDAIAPLETSHPLERFNLTIEEAEILAGFEMNTPSIEPQGFNLIGAAYDELREAIILHYATVSGSLVLRISQQKLDSDYQAIGPEAVVEKVFVGPYAGEFVAGGWMIPEVESGAEINKEPVSQKYVWDKNVNLQTLRWSDGEFLFEMIHAGSPVQDGYLDKNSLITLANRLH